MAVADKGDKPTEKQQAVIDELAKWIDTDVIASFIVEEMVDQGMEVTLANAKNVWLNILENGLPDDTKYAIEAINDGWKP